MNQCVKCTISWQSLRKAWTQHFIKLVAWGKIFLQQVGGILKETQKFQAVLVKIYCRNTSAKTAANICFKKRLPRTHSEKYTCIEEYTFRHISNYCTYILICILYGTRYWLVQMATAPLRNKRVLTENLTWKLLFFH